MVERAVSAAESEINGILATTGYTLPSEDTVPPLGTIARMLGVRHLLTREYGTGADGTSKDGAALKKDARALLDRILNNSIILTDTNGTLLLLLASNDTDDAADTCERAPIFSLGDTF